MEKPAKKRAKVYVKEIRLTTELRRIQRKMKKGSCDSIMMGLAIDCIKECEAVEVGQKAVDELERLFQLEDPR